MNSIPGTISHIDAADGLSIITVDVYDGRISAIVIDTPDTADYIRIGNQVNALIKETEIIIGLGLDPGVSVRNKLKCRISQIERGNLLSKVQLSFNGADLHSIIPSSAIDDLNLVEEMDVVALVKINEVMLEHD